jgi:hypothetical protein
MASSKLWPYQGMNATVTFEPSASWPNSVAGAVGQHVALPTFWPIWTSGRWLIAVSWLVRQYFLSL